QIREIEQARQKRLEQETETEPHAIVRQMARVIGIGIETADMLVNEVLSRPMRDRKAVARYAGLTGSPDESGARRREQGLARAGNARVRRGMIQWYRARTADSRLIIRHTQDDDCRAGTTYSSRSRLWLGGSRLSPRQRLRTCRVAREFPGMLPVIPQIGHRRHADIGEPD